MLDVPNVVVKFRLAHAIVVEPCCKSALIKFQVLLKKIPVLERVFLARVMITLTRENTQNVPPIPYPA